MQPIHSKKSTVVKPLLWLCFLFIAVQGPLGLFAQCPGPSADVIVNASMLDASGNYLASNPTSFNCNLIIPGGIKCTISNMTLTFAPDKGVIVQRGGVLYLHHATLDKCSSSPKFDWRGIQVLGNGSYPQVSKHNDFYLIDTNATTGVLTAVQGMLVMDSSTLIKHAYIGIEVGYASTTSYGGGIVRGAHSTIQNCVYGVVFRHYADKDFPERNLSYFKSCTFEWTDTSAIVPDSLVIDPWTVGHFRGWEALAVLHQVQGVLFLGNNKFQNTVPLSILLGRYAGYDHDKENLNLFINNEEFAIRGDGIRCDTSSFYLMPGEACKSQSWPYDAKSCIVCNGGLNTFSNLNRGIYIINLTSTDNQVAITGSYFLNNHYGVHAQWSRNIFVNRDSFIVDDDYASYIDIYDPIGIATYDCSKLDISNNLINTHCRIVNQQCYITEGAGILVKNSSLENTNRIYNNIYMNDMIHRNCPITEYGLWLVNNNSTLDIQCNTFNNTPMVGGADWYLSGDSTTNSRLKMQGTPSVDAANIFTSSCTTPPVSSKPLFNIQFNNWITAFDYYYYHGASSKPPVCIASGPSPYTTSTLVHKHFTSTKNSCPASSFCIFFGEVEDTSGWHSFGSEADETELWNPWGPAEILDDLFEKKGVEVGIKPFKEERATGFSWYPNPASGTLFMKYATDNYTDQIMLKVFDISGREIRAEALSPLEGAYRLDLTGMRKSIYLFKAVQKGLEIGSGKFMVE